MNYKRVISGILSAVLAVGLMASSAAATSRADVVPREGFGVSGQHLYLKSEHVAYVHGVGDGRFEPGRDVTKAEAAQMLWNLVDTEKGFCEASRQIYDDVSSDAWYYDAIQSLAASDAFALLSGEFRPGQAITRGEFVEMLVRALGLGYTPGASAEAPFVDIAGTEHEWAIRALHQAGWAFGSEQDGKFVFLPDGTLTRAEAVTFLNRVAGRGILTFETPMDEAVNFSDNADMSQWYYYDILEAANTHEYHVGADSIEFWDTVD